MTQRELSRAVAQANGETVDRIVRIGFEALSPAIPEDRDPLTVDWDGLDADRVAVFAQRTRCQHFAACWR